MTNIEVCSKLTLSESTISHIVRSLSLSGYSRGVNIWSGGVRSWQTCSSTDTVSSRDIGLYLWAFSRRTLVSFRLGSRKCDINSESLSPVYQGILSLVNMVALKIELENGSHAIRPFHSSTPIHLMYFCTRYSHIRLLKNKYL